MAGALTLFACGDNGAGNTEEKEESGEGYEIIEINDTNTSGKDDAQLMNELRDFVTACLVCEDENAPDCKSIDSCIMETANFIATDDYKAREVAMKVLVGQAIKGGRGADGTFHMNHYSNGDNPTKIALKKLEKNGGVDFKLARLDDNRPAGNPSYAGNVFESWASNFTDPANPPFPAKFGPEEVLMKF